MIRISIIGILLLIVSIAPRHGHSWELFDRVIAVVNDAPIVESEVRLKFEQLSSMKKIPASKVSYHKSRILDMFIEDMLFVQTADDESIIIGEKKIDDYVEKAWKRMNFENLDEFKTKLEKKDNISYEEYRDQIRRSITREMVMSIAVGVSPPSEDQAKEWYRKNKSKVGFEVNINHILMRVKNSTIAEERRVNNEMKKVQSKLRGGRSFESAAKEYSEDGTTKGGGGSMGWVRLAEMDRYLAMQVFNMNRAGQVSGVIKSGLGYHIVKFNGKRHVPYESIRDLIFNILYHERMGEQMSRWAQLRRKESDVKIYMPDYVLN